MLDNEIHQVLRVVKKACTIQFVIHHCFIVVSFCWVIAATRKIKLSMNITQNHGFAIRVWTMVWHRLSVKINISCLCPIEIYLNICNSYTTKRVWQPSNRSYSLL